MLGFIWRNLIFTKHCVRPMPVDSSHQQQNKTLDSDMYGCTLCYHYAMRQCIYSQASSAQRKTMTLLLCPFLVLHSPSSDVSAEVTDISCSFSHKLTRINQYTSHINLCMLYDITMQCVSVSDISFYDTSNHCHSDISSQFWAFGSLVTP